MRLAVGAAGMGDIPVETLPGAYLTNVCCLDLTFRDQPPGRWIGGSDVRLISGRPLIGRRLRPSWRDKGKEGESDQSAGHGEGPLILTFSSVGLCNGQATAHSH